MKLRPLVSDQQLAILKEIDWQWRPAKDVAQSCGDKVRRSSFHPLLDKLVARGWVRKEKERNGRIVVTITTLGALARLYGQSERQ